VPKVNNLPIGEILPNLVTLLAVDKQLGGTADAEPQVENRVTRCVCEKIAQNVAQPVFFSKLLCNVYRGNK
jgi:hypothetical protein